MFVYRRPLVEVDAVDDPTSLTVWDVLHGLVIAAQQAGAPARRVRLSSDYTALVLGYESGAFPGDPPRMIAQAGMDREGFEVWEDLTLAPGTAIVE